MNKGIGNLLAVLMKELGPSVRDSGRDYAVPEGWFSVDDIRVELRMAHTRNASTRAYDLFRRGMLERQSHRFKAATGQCNMAYIYRPLKPYRSIKEASERLFDHRADKIPKGWIRVVDYANEINISDVAVRGRIARANLKPKYWKTPRGIIGLHLNAFYKKSELDGLYRKR
jgi:predicted DNA-binding transcriptional regulator